MKTIVKKQPNQPFPWIIGRRDKRNRIHQIGSYLTWAKAMEIAHTINHYQTT